MEGVLRHGYRAQRLGATGRGPSHAGGSPTRAAAFVSEARRFHDESAARVAGILGDLQSSDDDDPAIQAMLASINQNDALAGDPLAEEAIRHLSLS